MKPVRCIRLIFCLLLAGGLAGGLHGDEQAPPTAYESIVSWLKSHRRDAGHPPDPSAVRKRIAESSAALPDAHKELIWEIWAAGQRPGFSVNEVVTVARERRLRIKTARIGGRAVWHKANSDGALEPVLYEEHLFVMKGAILRHDRSVGLRPDDLDQHYVEILEEDSGTHSNPSLEEGEREHWDVAFGEDEPFWCTYAIKEALVEYLPLDDDTHFPSSSIFYLEDDGYGVVVGSEPRIESIATAAHGLPPFGVFSFDREKQMVTVRLESARLVTDDPLDRLEPWAKKQVIEATDFVDCGEGIWLPRRIEITRFAPADEDTVEVKGVVTFDSVEVNVPIEDAELKIQYEPGSQAEITATIADLAGDAFKKHFDEMPEEEKERFWGEARENAGFRVIDPVEERRKRIRWIVEVSAVFLVAVGVIVYKIHRFRRGISLRERDTAGDSSVRGVNSERQ
jgi:hypothetical protein